MKNHGNNLRTDPMTISLQTNQETTPKKIQNKRQTPEQNPIQSQDAIKPIKPQQLLNNF